MAHTFDLLLFTDEKHFAFPEILISGMLTYVSRKRIL